MANETVQLAAYAAALRYEDLPAVVVRRAKDCLTDTIAAIAYGSRLPWSRLITDYVRQSGQGGRSCLFGGHGVVQAPSAALANGTIAHAFELDSLTSPSAGTHPGAILVPAVLAVAQERASNGREVIAAFVAGCEVMNRIGRGADGLIDGFHAPGALGPFGSAIAAGHLLKLDETAMTSALGIAGSMGCGLMQFAHSRTGGMLKKLHFGRAAESGVLAATLASKGFTGPDNVLEGEFGYLATYCRSSNHEALVAELGKTFETLTITIKRYPCHINAHTPIEALHALRAEHGFAGADIKAVTVLGHARMAKNNGNTNPDTLAMAQFSVPFSMALAMYRDPRSPASFDETALRDPAIRALCAKITVAAAKPKGTDQKFRETDVTVELNDGRKLRHVATSFKGMPQNPLEPADLREKFLLLTGDTPENVKLFERLEMLEAADAIDWIGQTDSRA
jgi:2-methylcitrate dehydratase PrpD